MKNLKTLAIVATMIFVGCNTNSPETNNLAGTWSEPYHVNMYVASMTFDTMRGMAFYRNRPDTTWEIVLDDAGEFATLNYSASNDKIRFSGYSRFFKDTTYFEYVTGYSIKDNTLTIDSFSYDGGIYKRFQKPLILYKQ